MERRFLVKNLNLAMPKPEKEIDIQQGYFEMADLEKSFRIRICNGQTASFAIKTGKGFVRKEFEHSIGLKFGNDLLNICNHRLNKKRLIIDGWEIDIYRPPLKGIIIAEKELNSIDEKFAIPSWLEEAVEVTDTLTNHHLARWATDLSGTNIVAMPHISNMALSSIKKIVLTGGPCSGKSTIIETIKKERPDVHCVPEMATVVINHFGIIPSKEVLQNRQLQRAIYRAQKIFEATSIQFAVSKGKKAILFDRGCPDGVAYFPGGKIEFQEFFNTNMKNEYAQYDFVLCMDMPSRKIYNLKKTKNPARMETYEQARELGEKIIKAWDAHPNFFMISNTSKWQDKQNYVQKLIKKLI